LPKAEARLLATGLKRWAQRPIRRANLRTAGIAAIAFAFTAIAAHRTSDPASAIRDMAILFAAAQSVAHVFTICMLRALAARGVAEAAAALASYRDPRRLSGMDLMVMWLAVAIAVPLFSA
jgi:hypothetical protein